MHETLNTYMREYWEHVLKFNPTFATYIGDHRYNDRLEDLSEEALADQAACFSGMLKKVKAVTEEEFAPDDVINFELLTATLGNHLALHEFETHLIPLDHMQGPHIDFPQIIEFHPFSSERDYESYIRRLNSFPLQIDQVIALFQRGIERKITAFGKIIDHVLKQVQTFADFAPEQHPLYSPVQKMEGTFSNGVREEIEKKIHAAVADRVTPAYAKLFRFLKDEYMQHCRDKEGLWALSRGEDIYRFMVKYHTTTELTAREIHETGLQEVQRITAEIREIMDRRGFSGTIREFADSLKQDTALHPESPEEIIEGYQEILSAMDRKLPQYFGRLPRAEYAVKKIEEYREQAAPAAYYYPPPQDFSRPGYFYANTYRPEQRPRFIMEALAYHEAVPGHHLQIALMQEQADMPEFRKYEGSTAFIEGWALYAEKLSGEMGCYQDDLSRYGRLNFEIWRAVRLVVDTGLHWKQWSRAEAVQYCLENSGEDQHEIEVEVDRYIAMPAQALAYKIGELKILELRGRAQHALGDRFSITGFHDRLLENGALPMRLLEQVMNRWAEDEMPAG